MNTLDAEHFVIVITSDNVSRFYAVDRDGLPYWSSFNGAKIFESIALAKDELETEDFTRRSTMVDGAVYPPLMIQSGLGLNKSKPQGSGVISIMKVMLSKVSNREINASITTREQARLLEMYEWGRNSVTMGFSAEQAQKVMEAFGDFKVEERDRYWQGFNAGPRENGSVARINIAAEK